MSSAGTPRALSRTTTPSSISLMFAELAEGFSGPCHRSSAFRALAAVMAASCRSCLNDKENRWAWTMLAVQAHSFGAQPAEHNLEEVS